MSDFNVTVSNDCIIDLTVMPDPPIGIVMLSDGPAGPPGPSGPAGTQWFLGTTAPSNSLGSNGDLYLNTTNSNYYEKFSGAWVLQGTLGASVIVNLDGGNASSIYGGVTNINAGGA